MNVTKCNLKKNGLTPTSLKMHVFPNPISGQNTFPLRFSRSMSKTFYLEQIHYMKRKLNTVEPLLGNFKRRPSLLTPPHLNSLPSQFKGVTRSSFFEPLRIPPEINVQLTCLCFAFRANHQSWSDTHKSKE